MMCCVGGVWWIRGLFSNVLIGFWWFGVGFGLGWGLVMVMMNKLYFRMGNRFYVVLCKY